MEERKITKVEMERYSRHLRAEERSAGTADKYRRDVGAFAQWLAGRAVTRELAAGWKEHLIRQGYAATTINSMLAALNGLFRLLGWEECRVKFLKIQRRLFRDPARELTRAEYDRLLGAARGRGQERLALLMEAICATGIRVSEVRYLTVDILPAAQCTACPQENAPFIRTPGSLLCRLLPALPRGASALQPNISSHLCAQRS